MLDDQLLELTKRRLLFGDQPQQLANIHRRALFMPPNPPDGTRAPRETLPARASSSDGAKKTTVVPMFCVDDIQTAVERVRAARGTASEPRHESYRIRAESPDDQGVRFQLEQQ